MATMASTCADRDLSCSVRIISHNTETKGLGTEATGWRHGGPEVREVYNYLSLKIKRVELMRKKE